MYINSLKNRFQLFLLLLFNKRVQTLYKWLETIDLFSLVRLDLMFTKLLVCDWNCMYTVFQSYIKGVGTPHIVILDNLTFIFIMCMS